MSKRTVCPAGWISFSEEDHFPRTMPSGLDQLNRRHYCEYRGTRYRI
jgi:hypothetical protein